MQNQKGLTLAQLVLSRWKRVALRMYFLAVVPRKLPAEMSGPWVWPHWAGEKIRMDGWRFLIQSTRSFQNLDLTIDVKVPGQNCDVEATQPGPAVLQRSFPIAGALRKAPPSQIWTGPTVPSWQTYSLISSTFTFAHWIGKPNARQLNHWILRNESDPRRRGRAEVGSWGGGWQLRAGAGGEPSTCRQTGHSCV